jgi:hypothetical protein
LPAPQVNGRQECLPHGRERSPYAAYRVS